MKHRWAVLMVCMLTIGTLRSNTAAAQETPPAPTPQRERTPGFELGQNYPNPFNPSTTIPFVIGDYPVCTDAARQYRVTLRVYNVLAQLVAIPILQGEPAPGQSVQNLLLACGRYTAYWNGNYLTTSREVASGIYLYQIQVDGRATVKKMLVMK